ncbi:MAG: hypothetical protein ACJ8DC_05220 [Gemmatimonadales bacterium]
MKAVLLERGEHLLSAEVGARYQVPTPTMQKALKALASADRTLLQEEEAAGGRTRYRLEDPFSEPGSARRSISES